MACVAKYVFVWALITCDIAGYIPHDGGCLVTLYSGGILPFTQSCAIVEAEVKKP